MKTNVREITLNFLPISKKEFTFKIWRRLVSANDERRWSEDIRRYKLPDENGEYKDYWVSFKRFEDSTECTISSNENIYTTNFYLYTQLKRKVKEAGINFMQKEKEKKFAPYHLYIVVDIVTERIKLGSKTIRFEPYYLKTKRIFGFLVDYKFIKEQNAPFNRKIQQLSFSLDENFRININYHIDKYEYILEFLKNNLKNFSTIENNLEILSNFQKLEYQQLKLRGYIFKNDKEGNSQFEGIKNYGPYKDINNPIRYVYIFHKDHKDYVNDFIKALNGEVFKTFEGLTKLNLPAQTKENTIGIPLESFEKNLKSQLDNIEKDSIIIAVFPAKEEKFYYTLKRICLEKDIPLQTVHLETIVDENKLKWSISGIALQILAKSGGIPWIVKAENQNCLIIGIGQSIERDNENNPIRFFAYSVLLDSSGRFLTIEPLANAIDKNQYLTELGKKISEIIKQYDNYNKIVFHIPEKISKDTIKKIENIIKENSSDIELYIIRVNDDSKFFGYDINNNSLIPYESSYIQISDKEFLLWTEGLNFHNPTPRKRYSNPIYIDFYYSNQSNINYRAFLQDILNLSGTNYRGFNAKSLPVSMFYPKLISRFYKFFKKYKINTTIEKRNKMWFL